MRQKYLTIILTVALILVAGCGIAGKDIEEGRERQRDCIKVASFNIQIFGQSKINKPDVMDMLSRIIKRYDVVAIQEVRSKEQNVMPLPVKLRLGKERIFYLLEAQ